MNSGPCDYELECIDLRRRVADLEAERDDWKASAIAQADLSVERLNRVQELEAALRDARDFLYADGRCQDGASPWVVSEVVGRMTGALASEPGPTKEEA